MKDKHNTKLTSLLLSLAVAGSIPSGVAQELAPDDPSVAADLAVWFRDAAGTFDPGTGVWADSSGNDRHAVPVGEVDVNAPLTYVGPTASTTSGGAFSVDDVPAVRFSNDADDLLVAADLNGDVGLTDLTIFVVYNVDFLAANPNLKDILRVRVWDEEGKIPDKQTPDFRHYAPLLQRVVDRHMAA